MAIHHPSDKELSKEFKVSSKDDIIKRRASVVNCRLNAGTIVNMFASLRVDLHEPV